VLRRLRGLFERYCAQNLLIECPGTILGADDARWGEVTCIARRGNRLEVTGWAQAAQVTLQYGEDHVTTATRPDPQIEAPGGRFALDLPAADGALQLVLADPEAPVFKLPQIAPRAYRQARRRLQPEFAMRLIQAMPLVMKWAFSKDPALRPQIRAALGFWVLPAARRMRGDLFVPAAATPVVPTKAFTCILPVYNAFDLLPEVLERVRAHTDVPWHLVIIEDASPDPAIRPFLRDWVAAQNTAAPGQVTLIENDSNLGFIGSVNRGFAVALARGGPVVLLNGDALVPQGWASRLLAPLLADPSVASTTPMSNDAEIFSVPVICARTDLAPGQGDALDAVARSFAPGAGDAGAPTGVGFCMGIAESWLAKIPVFDPVFGRGYGEEVDWCQKTRAMGARHLGVANLFVEHRGGASFGAEEKRRLIAENGVRISARYPSYDIEVQDHLRADPMITPRLALAVAWLAGQAGDRLVPVYLSHAMGGGVAQYLDHRLQNDIDIQGGAVILRIGTDARWRLEVQTALGVVMGETDDFFLVQSLLKPLTRRRIVYVCAVGDSDPLSIPDRLLDLAQAPEGGQAALEVMFHDFYPLSPSFTLLGQDARFHGVPSNDTTDPVHHAYAPLTQWRAVWGRVMERADQLTTFSHDSRAHVLAVWPEAAPRLRVIPHQLTHALPRLSPQHGPRPVVAILGNLNPQKGHALVSEMGRLLASGTRDLDLVLFGDIDPACMPPMGVTIHGPYVRADIPVLAHRYRISAWLIPSVYPETFSYTTHEALATGLPVFCLDLGAQAEAVRAAGPQGHVIARHEDQETQAQMMLDALCAATKELR
jgi:GT2 family glycosyltransferase/glycosyltransferase involved in cell wall biosynthesis